MTLQWTIIAFVLYIEIGITFILLLPWIRPTLWSKLFKSHLFNLLARHAHIYSVTFGFVLFVLFADGVRETMKYSHLEERITRTAESDATHHMRLFRAQRNLYISGFALLLFLVIKRIMALLMRGAQLEAASEAAMRQAESASKAAKTLLDASPEGDGDSDELRRQIKELGEELKKAQNDRDAMKAQAENLQTEYDRVSDELNAHERGSAKVNKKDD
ncbi:unnamed protein product [Caenorhabditis auriculariae]|uniref:Endoplasmic reticulum transmembrane protein n=1 Tax=Caenorhabditis auriculariae TaxID=2777116 RepID=A0A8S1HSM1_9PELO|nr:unnamed protein product [Caenorhabditis auriculariae]